MHPNKSLGWLRRFAGFFACGFDLCAFGGMARRRNRELVFSQPGKKAKRVGGQAHHCSRLMAPTSDQRRAQSCAVGREKLVAFKRSSCLRVLGSSVLSKLVQVVAFLAYE